MNKEELTKYLKTTFSKKMSFEEVKREVTLLQSKIQCFFQEKQNDGKSRKIVCFKCENFKCTFRICFEITENSYSLKNLYLDHSHPMCEPTEYEHRCLIKKIEDQTEFIYNQYFIKEVTNNCQKIVLQRPALILDDLRKSHGFDLNQLTSNNEKRIQLKKKFDNIIHVLRRSFQKEFPHIKCIEDNFIKKDRSPHKKLKSSRFKSDKKATKMKKSKSSSSLPEIKIPSEVKTTLIKTFKSSEFAENETEGVSHFSPNIESVELSNPNEATPWNVSEENQQKLIKDLSTPSKINNQSTIMQTQPKVPNPINIVENNTNSDSLLQNVQSQIHQEYQEESIMDDNKSVSSDTNIAISLPTENNQNLTQIDDNKNKGNGEHKDKELDEFKSINNLKENCKYFNWFLQNRRLF